MLQAGGDFVASHMRESRSRPLLATRRSLGCVNLLGGDGTKLAAVLDWWWVGEWVALPLR